MDIPKIIEYKWPDAEYAWDESLRKPANGGFPARTGITFWKSAVHPKSPTMKEIVNASKLVGYKNKQEADARMGNFDKGITVQQVLKAILEDRDGNPAPLDKMLTDYKAAG